MHIHHLLLLLFLLCGTVVQAQLTCQSGDCLNGHGIALDRYGNKYIGNFKAGKYHGIGRLYKTDNTIISTHWKKNFRSGKSIIIDLNKKTCKEEFWFNGSRYEGTPIVTTTCVSGDCLNGIGERKYSDGKIYKGTFKDGYPNGTGSMFFQNGNSYVGSWEFGYREGHGEFVFNTGGVSRSGMWVADTLYTDDVQKWAVIVGVADYQDSSITDLSFTLKDAEKVYNFLRSHDGGHLPEHQIKLLKNEEATLDNIKKTMEYLYDRADKNDLVLFYFAGHGLEKGFLPYDYQRDNNANLLDHKLVQHIISDSDAKFKLCIADACHSGSMLMKDSSLTRAVVNSKKLKSRTKRHYERLNRSKGGFAMILSSAKEEVSLETKKLQQGVFSYHFIEALKGKADSNNDNFINVEELCGYIQKSVQKATYYFQNPVFFGKYDADFIIGDYELDMETDNFNSNAKLD